MDKDLLYGDATPVRVTFAYGTIVEAASDTTPGSINFGYSSEDNCGAIFRQGKLMTGRVVDMTLTDAETDGMHNVDVKYIDTDGQIITKTFQTVDEDLIQEILAGGGSTVYMGSEFIDISDDKVISVKYENLYNKIKDDLAAAGIGDSSTINKIQSEHIFAIEHQYVKTGEVVDTETDGVKKLKITNSTKETPVSDAVDTILETDIIQQSYVDGKIEATAEELRGEFKEAIDTSVDQKIDAKIEVVATELGEQISSNTEAISTVDTKVETVRRRVDVVDSSISLLVEENKTIEDAVQDNTEKIGVIEASIGASNERIDVLDSSIDATFTTLNDKIDSEIQTLSEKSATVEDLNELESRTDVLDSSVEDLKNEVEELKKTAKIDWVDIHDLLD